MAEKKKLEADARLITKLFDTVPLDWNRRPNGDLVFLNERGQKFVYSDAEILEKIKAADPIKPKPKTKTKSKAAVKAGAPPAQKPAAGETAALPAAEAPPEQ